MSSLLSLVVGVAFIGLAYLLRGQPDHNRLGFIMLMVAGVVWLVAGTLGYLNA